MLTMSENYTFTTTNPLIIEFFKTNPLVNFENLCLQVIDEHNNQKTKTSITKDEMKKENV